VLRTGAFAVREVGVIEGRVGMRGAGEESSGRKPPVTDRTLFCDGRCLLYDHHEISTLIKLWISQGKPTMAGRFRFVQQIFTF
jgi:hypothetical protein